MALRLQATTRALGASRHGLLPMPQRRFTARIRAIAGGHEQLAQAAQDLATAMSGQAHSMAHAVNTLATLADDAAAGAAATAAASSGGGGPVDLLANGFERFLTILEDGLDKANVPYAYGFAIIILTVLVKAATYPLSKKSMESTLAIQALQPRVKELQARYANDPETLQLETARLYRENNVNPLAGCLPTLATIPVFIGLYRALTKAADDGLLTSGFFWIPSLGGPTSMSMRQSGAGLSWLFPFQNGAPPIGWHDAGAYLVLPVLLVVSQYVSQKVISPQQNQDPNQQGAQAVLKFIPFMIGWFSLNVPSGLTLYWFINNVLSTAQQLYMRSTIKFEPKGASAAPAAGGGTVIDVSSQPIRPKEERVKKVSGKELGSRKKKGGEEAAPEASTSSQPAASSNNGRGQKFRARKAREAAAKASSIATGQPPSSNGAAQQQQQQQSSITTATSELDQLKVPDAPPSKE